MAKNSITDYSKTASLNTDIQSVDIDEACLPSGINNAIRELMADLAAMNDGTVSLTSPAFTSVDINGGTIDGVTIGGTTPAAGTFTTLTASGDVAIDTNTLFVDVSANAVGIGSTDAASYGKFLVNGTGNLINANASSGAATFQLYEAGSGRFGITTLNGSAGAKFTTAGTERMRIDSAGNVGIGVVPSNNSLSNGIDSANGLGLFGYNDGFYLSGNAYYDGAWKYKTSGAASKINSNSTGDIIFSNAASGSQDGSITWSDNVTIDSSGNVGIGTSSPAAQLHVQNSSGNSTSILGQYGTGTRAEITAFANQVELRAYNGTNDVMTFKTGSSERMRIDSSGKVGIGTSSPATANGGLHIHDSIYPEIQLTDSDSGSAFGDGCIFSFDHPNQYVWNREDGPLIFGTNNAERLKISKVGSLEGIITNNGTYTNGTASSANVVVASGGQFLRSVSAGKYKTNVEDVEASYAEALYDLRSVYYRSNIDVDNPNHSHWGFIAEEVAAIDPRLVHYKTVEVTHDEKGAAVETELDTPVAEGVQYERFVPLLLKLIKDQKDRIEDLETKVADFETRLTQLETN